MAEICSKCKVSPMLKVNHQGNNDTFIVVAANKTTGDIDMSKFIPVDMYGCPNCKHVEFKCESLGV